MSLEVAGLTAGYGSAVVIRNVSFAVAEGEALALMGKNGMGKTTLVKAILGFLPSTGEVRILGRDVGGAPTHATVRLGVGYAPQDAAIFGELSVNENLRLGAMRVPNYTEARDRVLAHFPVLSQRLGQQAGTLSGGEQKMLILARALIPEPAVLILDEISEGLQPLVLNVVKRVIQEERRRRRLTLLLVEQNVDFALAVADRVAVLQVGEVLFESATAAGGVRGDIVGAFAL
jgi:branched-chain amino acid transport system ATP-binding protein